MKLPTVHLICNAHLDPVWQWRWEEGCAEALSTFATAAAILREHPSLIFNHNEAVLYAWVCEYAPALFDEIKSLVEAGRWHISGGWFLQPDVNLPDTESLIRHIALGRQFFREHFGAAPEVAYNFDSFGHSAGLPQILVRSGFKMYIHMRPQHPDLVLPSDLYRWRGADGSEIAALRIVVGLYHTERDNMEQRLKEGVELALKLNRDVPVFWGIGDHGGGPTREDLKIIYRFIANENRVRISHSTPERLYHSLKDAAAAAPVIEGDLQRVFTGCYTSLSRVKRGAVKSIGTIIQTEALRAATWWDAQQEFPAKELGSAWKDHLFNDFHDILPGTCIEPAEQDALGAYAKAEDTARRARLGAAAWLNRGQPRRLYIPVTVLNTNPGCRKVPVEVECMLDLRPKWSGRWHLRLHDLQGNEVPCQEEQPESLLPFNGWRRKISFMADLPAVGCSRYELRIVEGESNRPALEPGCKHAFDAELGLVTGLLSPQGQQCLAGPLLKALVFEDAADAWGTDHRSYRDLKGEFQCVPGKVATLSQGPIRTITESVHQYGRSRVVLQTIAYPGWDLLEFRARVLWQEERCRLKFSIPTTLKFGSVLCEVPGGVFSRPADGQEHVHRRWLLLESALNGEATGLAIIHQGCHGFDAQNGEVRLSVLRSGAYCHEQGFKLGDKPARKYMDQGVHELRFLVVAGRPEELRGRVSALADWLTAPPAVYAHLPIGTPETASPGLDGMLETLPASVRLLALKPSWDQQSLVLRLQEIAGAQRTITLGLGKHTRELEFQAFAIKTLRIERDGSWCEVDLIEETRPVRRSELARVMPSNSCLRDSST